MSDSDLGRGGRWITSNADEFAVREHPILFGGPMVRAILDDKKTQTRRVMKVQPVCEGVIHPTPSRRLWYLWPTADGERYCQFPYGQAGDRLWVRETLVCGSQQDLETGNFSYLADRICVTPDERKIPAIHAPRWTSRITLLIEKVWVDRVQRICFDDIEAEGTPHNPMKQASYRTDTYQRLQDFVWLWDSINGKRGYGWAVNPWVWVVEFKRVTP